MEKKYKYYNQITIFKKVECLKYDNQFATEGVICKLVLMVVYNGKGRCMIKIK